MILLVDDEEGVLEICRDLLDRYGYEAATARSGEEALEVYRKEGGAIDLVFLDLHMPGMGGRRCMQALLDINPGLRVVVATGDAYGEDAKEALEMGAVRFVPKPYRLTDMLEAVKESLAVRGPGIRMKSC